MDVLASLLSDTPVAESDRDKPGVILDCNAGGNMVSFEILDASKRMANPMSVEYAVTPSVGRIATALTKGPRTLLAVRNPRRYD